MKLFSSLDFAKIKPDEQSLIGVGLLFKMIPDYTAHYICLKNDFFCLLWISWPGLWRFLIFLFRSYILGGIWLESINQ
jgi:hypothetical protein